MSALQATQADGFYYPPGWDPSKGSLDKYHGSHGKFGARKKKEHLGILVVRIELPHHAWCLGCGRHLGRGVRFNAEKQRVGQYHSTPILEFRFTCPSCSHACAMRTDPEKRGYKAHAGIRWQAREREAQEGDVGIASADDKLALASDPLLALEHATRDERKAAARGEALERLIEVQARGKDDYAGNAALRARMRPRRAQAKKALAEGKARGMAVPLLPLEDSDTQAAIAALSTRQLPPPPSALAEGSVPADTSTQHAARGERPRPVVRVVLRRRGTRRQRVQGGAVALQEAKRPRVGLVEYSSSDSEVSQAGRGGVLEEQPGDAQQHEEGRSVEAEVS